MRFRCASRLNPSWASDHAAPANRLQRIGSLDVPPQQSLFTAFGGGPSIFSRIKTTVVPDRNEERGTTSTSLSEQIRNARKMSDGNDGLERKAGPVMMTVLGRQVR